MRALWKSDTTVALLGVLTATLLILPLAEEAFWLHGSGGWPGMLGVGVANLALFVVAYITDGKVRGDERGPGPEAQWAAADDFDGDPAL